MAALGAVALRPSFPPTRATYIPVTHYTIVRGKYLGTVLLRDPRIPRANYVAGVSNYVVRQIRVVYRQLWPSHGQRFPQ